MNTIYKESDLKRKGIEFILEGRKATFIKDNKKIQLPNLPEKFTYLIENGEIFLKPTDYINKNFQKIFYKKIVGTYISLFKNVVIGLTTGYHQTINLIGSGYRSNFENASRILKVNAGYSHSIDFKIPLEIKIELEANGTTIRFSGHDKQQLTQCVAKIYDSKKRNVYKGTGIYRSGQKIRLKEIKKK